MQFALVGRDKERTELERLVIATREGLSGAVVIRGEAGVGKTALLEAAVRDAPDLRHLHLSGVEAESGFAFAGLHRLLVGQLAGAAELPTPQREALDVAFGRSPGPAADPFLVGLATLSLLAQIATGRPTLVTVDDAHWLDRESLLVLGFTARRLDAEGVAMVFAARHEGMDLSPFDGLASIDVEALPDEDALELLRMVVGGTVDRRVADRVLQATSGNPLALRDLGASLSVRQLDGSEALPEPLSVGRRMEDHYVAVVERLPEPTRRWLLLASAEPLGDLAAITAAAARLVLPSDAAEPAERARVVALRGRVVFRHPLVRSAVYGAATAVDRRTVHHVLAQVITPDIDQDRHVGHLANAAAGPDEVVAAELERAAERAEHRGGFAARAELLHRAATLTPDPGRAAGRTLAAAESAFQAGSYRRSVALLEDIDPRHLDHCQQARRQLVEAHSVGLSGDAGASGEISMKCLRAAVLARDDDADLAQRALAMACIGAMFADRHLEGTTLEEIADSARSTPAGSGGAEAMLVAAFAGLVSDGYVAAMPAIDRAVGALLDPATPDDIVLQRYVLGVTLCTVRLDHATAWALEERAVRIARATGALGQLDALLYTMSMTATVLGHLDEADDLLSEGVQLHTVLARSSREFDIYRHPELAAWRGGDRSAIEETIRLTAEAGVAMGHGAVVTVAEVGRMILELSCGDYDAASVAASGLIAQEGFSMHTRVLPDLVEAASRSGRRDDAAEALELLRSRVAAARTPLGLGVLARAEALMAEGSVAEGHYREAVERLGAPESRADLARAHLVYGEWLRRQRRRTDARDQLRMAHDRFTAMGAAGFAERARIELAATGERVRSRTEESSRELTSQERQIAMLAAEGLTNAEIASRLFISAPTVDYHLRKVYRKLDIGSRRQLRGRTF